MSFKVEVIADSSGKWCTNGIATKPRARWNACGVGYWTVRTIINGCCYQGVGTTLDAAYSDWTDVMRQYA